MKDEKNGLIFLISPIVLVLLLLFSGIGKTYYDTGLFGRCDFNLTYVNISFILYLIYLIGMWLYASIQFKEKSLGIKIINLIIYYLFFYFITISMNLLATGFRSINIPEYIYFFLNIVPLILFIIQVIYYQVTIKGITNFIKKHKKIIIRIFILIVLICIFIGVYLYGNVLLNWFYTHFFNKTSCKNLINKTVYVKENGNYEPYIVVDDNYGYTDNSLIIRKNALSEKFEWGNYNTNANGYLIYENSNIDKYLNSDEWLSRFEKSFLQTINYTKVFDESYNISYNYKEYTKKYNQNYSLERYFFILNNVEIHGFFTSKEVLMNKFSYLDTEKYIYDDNGTIVECWYRDKDYYNLYSGDMILASGSICKFKNNIRPAFTISNKEKVIKSKNVNGLSKGCWIIE